MEKRIRHIISINDMTKNQIISMLDLAKKMESLTPIEKSEILKTKVISTLFFEPSTRTKLSFEAAAAKLGAEVLRFPELTASSLQKGESFEDTIRMLDSYSDLIVIRHPIDGAAKLASLKCEGSVINGGDGSNQHPSQTLLDLYTIVKEKQNLNNLNIAFVGDLKYGRTVHSLTKAISYFNPIIHFISPPNLQIPDHILHILDIKKVPYHIHTDFREILPEIDVMYMTRIQKERFPDVEEYDRVKNIYVINKDNIVGKCKKDMIIMHPLPRVGEIATDLDETPHAVYFEQAKNGIPVRQAMMTALLHDKGLDF